MHLIFTSFFFCEGIFSPFKTYNIFRKTTKRAVAKQLVQRSRNDFDTEGFTGNAYSSGWLKNG